MIFFYAALLVSMLYPAFLLRSSTYFIQRNFSFIADTVLDVIYALVPFVFLALGVRSQPMIIPHDPIGRTSNLFPMLHAHFVISVLESAAEEAAGAAESSRRDGVGRVGQVANRRGRRGRGAGAAGDEALSNSNMRRGCTRRSSSRASPRGAWRSVRLASSCESCAPCCSSL